MARDDHIAFFRFSTRSLKDTQRRLRRAESSAQFLIGAGLELIAEEAVFALRLWAPERTGRLHEGITVSGKNLRGRFLNVRVSVSARSEDEFFDYVPVTRFGRKEIVPKRRAQPSVALGGRTTVFGDFLPRHSAAALKFEHGKTGEIIFRRRVRPWKPAEGDWVERAEPQIRHTADQIMRRDVAPDVRKLLDRPGFSRVVRVRRLR